MEVIATRGARGTGTSKQGEKDGPDGQSTRPQSPISAWFVRVAGATATAMGTPWSFLTALAIIIAWAVSGPIFGFSDTWQLVINTGTTIVTFLMVFLIQNTQNRDAKALHLKLDELIRAVESARNNLIDIEQSTDEDLAALQEKYRTLKDQAPPDGTPPLPESPQASEAGRPQHAENPPDHPQAARAA